MNILHSFSAYRFALELKDELEESCEREQFFEGITVSHKEIGKKGLKETVIKIESEAGEKQLGKPQGIYITLEGENMAGNDGGFHEEMSNHLAKRLAKLLLGRKKLLFIGLGNGEVTPDALGPLVIKKSFCDETFERLEGSGRMSGSSGAGTGSDGTDRNGNGRDRGGNREKDSSGCANCN